MGDSPVTPRRTRTRPAGRQAAVVAVLLLSLGCSPEPPASDPTEPTEPSEATEEPTAEPHEDPPAEQDPAEPVVVEQTVWNFAAGEEVDLRVVVHPFVRIPTGEDDEGLLNGLMTYEVISAEGEYHLEGHGVDPQEVRLVDTRAMTLSYPAYATDGTSQEHLADVERSQVRAGDDPVRWAGVHRDPGTDTTAVLLPYLGLIEGVGIVDAQDVNTSEYLPVQEVLSELVDIRGSTWDLQDHRELADGDIRIRETAHDATLTLDSEVLFADDDHELTEDAGSALQAAAVELEHAAGGELQIVGHTDATDPPEDGQQLSEDRAAAVHERLDELIDLADFTILTEGRAAQEPVSDQDTEQARAANRRVELHYTPAPDRDVPAEEAELPPTEGPVGTAGEPVIVTGEDGGAVEVTVEEVYSAGDLLVGRVRVEVVEELDGEDHAGPLARVLSFGDLGTSQRQGDPYDPGHQADALSLLVGGQRHLPLEIGDTEHIEGADEDGFIIEPGGPWRAIAGDRGFGIDTDAEIGTWSVATVLWPHTGQDEVVVDVPGRSEHADRPWSEPWRVEDVPVEAER